MRSLLFSTVFLLVLAAIPFAQPRITDGGTSQSMPAKYEGGMFGFNSKETGTLRFDDLNSRLVFFGKDQKERFSLPYRSILMVTPTSKSVRSAAGTAAGTAAGMIIPGGGLLGMIREKRRYMTIQFDDPDVEAKGTVSFKVGDKQMVDSTIRTLGQKAALTQRGDGYYRPRPVKPGQ